MCNRNRAVLREKEDGNNKWKGYKKNFRDKSLGLGKEERGQRKGRGEISFRKWQI